MHTSFILPGAAFQGPGIVSHCRPCLRWMRCAVTFRERLWAAAFASVQNRSSRSEAWPHVLCYGRIWSVLGHVRPVHTGRTTRPPDAVQDMSPLPSHCSDVGAFTNFGKTRCTFHCNELCTKQKWSPSKLGAHPSWSTFSRFTYMSFPSISPPRNSAKLSHISSAVCPSTKANALLTKRIID